MNLRQRIMVKILLGIVKFLNTKYSESSIHEEVKVINDLIDNLSADVNQLEDPK